MASPPVDEALGATFRLVFRNFGVYARTQGVVALVVALVVGAISLAFLVPSMSRILDAAFAGDPARVLVALVPLVAAGAGMSLVSFVGNAVAIGLGVNVSRRLLEGAPKPTFRQAWRETSPRMANLLGTSVLIALALFGVMLAGFALFFLVLPLLAALVAVVYLGVRWCLAIPASVLERRSVVDNLKRSAELGRGARVNLLLSLVVLVLATGFVSGALSAPFALAFQPDTPELGENATEEEIRSAIRELMPSPWALGIQMTIGAVVNAIGSLFFAALLTFYFERLRPAPIAEPPATGV